MSDPVRWSDSVDAATESEQLLVRSAQECSMPAAEKQAVWSQILGVLPPIADVPMPAKAAAAAHPGLAFKGLKLLCLAAAASGLTVGGYHWFHKPNSVVAATPPASSASSDVAPPSVALGSTETAPALDEAAGPVQSATPMATSGRTSSLREESLAVMAARQALRSNDTAGALRLLEQAQQRFKKGALTEERESLTIEALAKSGRKAQASARASAFLSRYPRSPHAADVQRYVLE
jgi:hypothetical protein